MAARIQVHAVAAIIARADPRRGGVIDEHIALPERGHCSRDVGEARAAAAQRVRMTAKMMQLGAKDRMAVSVFTYAVWNVPLLAPTSFVPSG